MAATTTMVECSECGHLHFNGEYVECPLESEGCKCPKVPAKAAGTTKRGYTRYAIEAYDGLRDVSQFLNEAKASAQQLANESGQTVRVYRTTTGDHDWSIAERWNESDPIAQREPEADYDGPREAARCETCGEYCGPGAHGDDSPREAIVPAANPAGWDSNTSGWDGRTTYNCPTCYSQGIAEPEAHACDPKTLGEIADAFNREYLRRQDEDAVQRELERIDRYAGGPSGHGPEDDLDVLEAGRCAGVVYPPCRVCGLALTAEDVERGETVVHFTPCAGTYATHPRYVHERVGGAPGCSGRPEAPKSYFWTNPERRRCRASAGIGGSGVCGLPVDGPGEYCDRCAPATAAARRFLNAGWDAELGGSTDGFTVYSDADSGL